jgi:hypothetical protein
MSKEKRKIRKSNKTCHGCNKGFNRKDYNEHVLNIVRGMRQ